jgi:hypothetical protein
LIGPVARRKAMTLLVIFATAHQKRQLLSTFHLIPLPSIIHFHFFLISRLNIERTLIISVPSAATLQARS